MANLQGIPQEYGFLTKISIMHSEREKKAMQKNTYCVCNIQFVIGCR